MKFSSSLIQKFKRNYSSEKCAKYELFHTYFIAGDASLAPVCKSCLTDRTKRDGLCQTGYKHSSSWAKQQTLNPDYIISINRGNEVGLAAGEG